MTFLAKGFPVGLIPEQSLVSPVRNDTASCSILSVCNGIPDEKIIFLSQRDPYHEVSENDARSSINMHFVFPLYFADQMIDSEPCSRYNEPNL